MRINVPLVGIIYRFTIYYMCLICSFVGYKFVCLLFQFFIQTRIRPPSFRWAMKMIKIGVRIGHCTFAATFRTYPRLITQHINLQTDHLMI